MSTATYREPVTWQPERPRFRLGPGRNRLDPRGARAHGCGVAGTGRLHRRLLGSVARFRDRRRAERGSAPAPRGAETPLHARRRFPARPAGRRVDAARRGRDHGQRDPPGLLLDRAPRRARRLGGDRRPRGHHRLERRRHLHDQGHPAAGEAVGRAGGVGPAGNRLPRDRRPRAAHPPQRDAGRERAAHGELDGRARLRAHGVGARPLVPDGGEPGGDPARLERGHPGLPLGREGDRPPDDVLGSARLRGDRAAAGDGDRASHQRRREPREPPLRRGRPRHPHRQPDGGGEEGEPRLPRLLRERVQRDPVARALLLGGRPRDHLLRPAAPARRPAARPPRRHLPVHARGDVRGRPRPDRLRRPHGHDEGPPRDLRDLLELRRGRASLRARAHRHAGGAAQARRAVRAHRARAAVRAAALRDRRPLRSRADAGRDLQAAQRLRARRARRALPLARER